jgi:endonuclease
MRTISVTGGRVGCLGVKPMSDDAVSRQRFTIANPDNNGAPAPMKDWLRDPNHKKTFPEGEGDDFPEKNSRYIARKLLADGWSSRVTPGEFRLFPKGVLPPEIPPEPPEPPDELDPSFRLEAELRDFLANNLGLVKVGGQSLHLHRVEFPTATGPIDILATDDAGAFYVFELKRAASPDKAIGQVTRYMGWVMENLANGKPVFGLVVAKEITERLKYAVLAIPNVSLFEYQVAFTLRPVTRAAQPERP